MDELTLALEPLLDDGLSGEAGEFRNQNKAGQTYRRTLIDTPKVNLKISLLGHGKLSPVGEEASLLVFDFRLTPSKTTRRFKQASFSVIFRDTEGDSLLDPEIYRIAPEGAFAINPWILSTNIKNKFELGGNIGLPQGGLNANYGRESEHEKTAESSVTLVGRSRVERGFGEPTSVYWEMEEDAKRKMGTPTFLRVAVILRRRSRRNFTFSLQAETSVQLKLGERIKTVSFFGRTGRLDQPMRVDDVEIDPASVSLKAQDNALSDYEKKIDWNNLHELNLQNDLTEHVIKAVLGPN